MHASDVCRWARCTQVGARPEIQHSPSHMMQPKHGDVCGNLPLWQGLGEDVGCHVICWAVGEHEGVVCDGLLDEMIVNVDVFCLGMVVVFDGKFDCSLVVTEESGWGRGDGEQFKSEASKPDCLFGHMCRGNILSLSSRQGDNFLFAGLPRNGTTINEESIT